MQNTRQAAQDDNNTEKSANNIVGTVSVAVSYDGSDASNTTTVEHTNEKIPENIDIMLLQSGVDYEMKTGTAADAWKFSFINLPKYDVDGKVFTYAIKEMQVSGYELTAQTMTAGGDGNSWQAALNLRIYMSKDTFK